MPDQAIRLAHISDLHFSKLCMNVTQFFSKRWLGTANLVLSRQNNYLNKRPFSLIRAFKHLKVSSVLITGDLTTTSFSKEFIIARHFVDRLKQEGFHVYLIPGNHDHYTKKDYRHRTFYRYFQPFFGQSKPSFTLLNEGVTSHYLGHDWWIVGMDTALATPFYESTGYFSPTIEKNLEKVLKTIPENQKILLTNHFPFFQHDHKRRRLKRGIHLKALIQKHPNIQLFLHGHTHRRCIADLRASQLPIILDSGSTSYKWGSWNLLDLKKDQCHLKTYQWKKTLKWECIETHNFEWKETKNHSSIDSRKNQ